MVPALSSLYLAGLVGWTWLPRAAAPAGQVVLFLLLAAILAMAAEEITGGSDGS